MEVFCLNEKIFLNEHSLQALNFGEKIDMLVQLSDFRAASLDEFCAS